MALFNQNQNVAGEVLQLRNQGLTDNVIMSELGKKGYDPEQIHQALSQADTSYAADDNYANANGTHQQPAYSSSPSSPDGNIYERIEEIAESLIDEKWEELIGEVKKIVEWKTKIEERQTKIQNDLDKLKEDFKTLHQGVLGKLEDYDTRMKDVGTELKAVGKVFRDVVPQFVENVKELSSVTERIKEEKEKHGSHKM